MTFQSHCESLGIHLLKDDIRFIKSQLLQIPQQLHKPALQKYADIYLEGMAQCDSVIQKQNTGRRAANKFIQELVDGSARHG